MKSVLLCTLLFAWSFFGGSDAKKSAEKPAAQPAPAAEAVPAKAAPVADTKTLVDAAVSNAVQRAIADAAAKAAADAAAKAATKAAEEAAAKAAKEAAAQAAKDATTEKAAKEAAKAEAKEAKTERQEEMKRIESRIFHLQHASAEEVAEKFNKMWSGDFGVTWKITKMAVAFPESNSIMMTAPRAIIMACDKVLKELDIEAPQVYIEARFVELGNTASHKVGIDWSGILGGTKVTGTIGGGFQTTRLGPGVDGYTRSLSGRSGSDTVTETYNLTGTKDSDGMISYINGTLSVSEMALILSALDATEDAKTFSNPKIIVSSGKKATVDMTTKYPNVKISAKRTDSSGSQSLDIASNMEAIPGEDKFMFAKEAFFSWGITLEVTPRISTNGLINVSIVPTISDRNDWIETGTTSDSSSDSGTVSAKYPVIKVQRLVSEFNLESGTTAVIGGLSITTEKQVDNGIPLLRKIPWIGPRLFGSMERVKEQKEIVVFVTVGIINPRRLPQDAGLPKNAVLGRQYTEGQKLEPGDRPAKNMEGQDSLDMRLLEEQAKDPLNKKKPSNAFDFRNYIPFQKDTKEEENK